MNDNLISVIVPVYNIEEYLDKCVESIIKQTHENLEILLIDDGSTDHSGKKCDAWAKKDYRVKVIHKENGGVSSARNVGLEIATGKYIGFVDSDDCINENMYKKLMNQMIETNSDMCFCNYVYINNKENTTVNTQLFCEKKNDKNTIMKKMFECKNANFAVWNKLIKREFLKNIRFDESIKIYEDAVFNFECLDKMETIAFVEEYLYFYEVGRESSALHKFNLPKKITMLDAMIKIDQILEKNNLDIKERFYQQAEFIGKIHLYEKLAKKENLTIDFTKYKKIAKEYIKNGLLRQKIGLKNRLKVLFFMK